ncbi:hypothetical protein E3Q22_01168 [Wallemia mellicola]|uniref:C2H2-type domain-containing protein n=2 Tax=Wallemia mellicola TaxID=1708541 RepID=A0A4T0NWK0_9BASI|nr:hypothetical protein WALSEDRAFT_69186 [Wallemia mellicola CBS 633.66]TIB76462.1 hypothetical protein E3Q23_01825 [Wallemia mellicola]EIM21337.1 hypothetical protein WALSEDRAFT_69186 [Wallemia mellicola CBS 633.66]TIB81359.1 hypothetical protein E3Q22_01168 [Wallemia mellicola]TIB88724.1 hypothetical protein E3Q21_00882 [Wallemia mellicola]TIB91434.1 hypothetical protein E3Q20_00868 [Wallemia mellicola]|eukprot:XP_006958685.1 hypothetical protein WALSEDRAFT_69186 [Wallemia mellicola CBS 633.66]
MTGSSEEVTPSSTDSQSNSLFDNSSNNRNTNASTSYTSASDVARPELLRKRSNSLTKLAFLTHQKEQQFNIQKTADDFYTSDRSSPHSNKQKDDENLSEESYSTTSSNKTRRHTFSGNPTKPLFIDFTRPIVQPSIKNLVNQDQSPPTRVRASILRAEEEDHQFYHQNQPQQHHHHYQQPQSQHMRTLPSEPLPQMPAALPTPAYRKYHRPHGQGSEQPPDQIAPSSSSNTQLPLPSLQNWSLDYNAPSKKTLGKKRKVGSNNLPAIPMDASKSTTIVQNARMANHEQHTNAQALAASKQDFEYANSSIGKQDTSQNTSNASTSKGKVYTCQYCSKTFNRPSSLKIHTYSHTGERPFVCQVNGCNRSFSVASNLKRHAKVHNNNLNNGNISQQHNQVTNSNFNEVDSPPTKDSSPTLNSRAGSGDGQTSSGSGDSKQDSAVAGEYADAEDNSSSGNEKRNNLVPAENNEALDEEEVEDESVTLAKDVNNRKKNTITNNTPNLDRTAQLIDGKVKSTMGVPQTKEINHKRIVDALNQGRSISIDGKSLHLQQPNRSIDENGTIISSKFQNQDRQAFDHDDSSSSNEIYSSPNDEDTVKPPNKKVTY